MLSHWRTSKTVRSVKESVTKDHIWRVSVYMKCSSSLSTHNLCSCFYWELSRALGITRCLTFNLAWAVLCCVGRFSRVRLLATPTTSAHQVPLSILPIFSLCHFSFDFVAVSSNDQSIFFSYTIRSIDLFLYGIWISCLVKKNKR